MKLKDRLKSIAIFVVMLLLSSYTIAFADVGSFESYDSGSSSWDSSSSWSSSDYDYDYDYDSGSSWSSGSRSGSYSSGSSSFGDFIFFLIFMTIVIVIIVNKSKGGYKNKTNRPPVVNDYVPQGKNQDQIEAEVKAVDPLFNREEFISWAKSLFVKLQEAWSDRDWSTIRTFESNELFEQHQRQLQGYIDNNQINVMERICVKFAKLESFEQIGDKDVMKVVLSSKMVDYIIDATTKKLLKGDKTTERHSTYRLTFIRKTGVKTKEGTSQVNTTNCPNCGAPTEITSSGKCEYCGSVVTTGEYSWVLSDLTKIN